MVSKVKSMVDSYMMGWDWGSVNVDVDVELNPRVMRIYAEVGW